MHGPESLDKWLANGVLISDGAWGTQLQARGLPAGIIPDTWNLTLPSKWRPWRARMWRREPSDSDQQFPRQCYRHARELRADLDAINRAAVTISKKAAGARALVFASIGRRQDAALGEVSAEELTAHFPRRRSRLPLPARMRC